MSDFNVGDAVKRVQSGSNDNMYEGDTGTIIHTDGVFASILLDKNGQMANSCALDNYELIEREKTMDNLKTGDILIDDDGDKVTVLAVIENLIALSYYNEPTDFNEWSTLNEVKKHYKLPDSKKEFTEVTLESIAELVGVPVENLRIKD